MPCVEWEGGRNAAGYGRATARLDAHRKVWIDAHGPIPEGMQVHHVCENKACVNLDHLRLVTSRQHHVVHQKSRCKRGHRFTPDNTRIYPNGARQCRTCLRERDRRRRAVSV